MNSMETLVPVVAKMCWAWRPRRRASFLVHQCSRIFLSIPDLGGDDPWHHDRRLAARFQRIDDVLEKELVMDILSTACLGNVRARPRRSVPDAPWHPAHSEVAEIHLEGRIGDDVVELLQHLALPVIGVEHSVALDDVGMECTRLLRMRFRRSRLDDFCEMSCE